VRRWPCWERMAAMAGSMVVVALFDCVGGGRYRWLEKLVSESIRFSIA